MEVKLVKCDLCGKEARDSDVERTMIGFVTLQYGGVREADQYQHSHRHLCKQCVEGVKASRTGEEKHEYR